MVQNSEILITGGYGFIGAYLARSLARTSLENSVTVFDSHVIPGTTGDDFNLEGYDNITVVTGSVTNPKDFSELQPNFDYIVNAAGLLGIDQVAEQQLLTLDTNILGAKNCLEFATKHKPNPFVLMVSTSEIYGIDCARLEEGRPAVIPSSGSRWGYAISKMADEYYLRAYNQSHGIPGGIVRPFNVFGPHRYGTNAITTLVKHAVLDEELSISGDGQQVRSWCYIDDFCDGALKILEYAPDTIEAFNIGDDRNIFTMSGLASKIIEAADSRSKVRILDDKREDVRYRVPNIDKARGLLDYEPQFDFETGLANVVDWVRSMRERAYQ